MKKRLSALALVLFIISMPMGFSSSVLFSNVGVPRVEQVVSEEREGEGITRYVYGSGLVASVSNGETEYYHQDRLRSNRVTTDSSGEITGKYYHLPFGQPIIDEVEYGFTGKEEDESGLHYFGARYYDSNLGRFTRVDPVPSEPAYQYVANNPMNFVDPTGMIQEYTISTGDTLSAIARNYDTSVDNLVKLNSLSDPNSISVGQSLTVPGDAFDSSATVDFLAQRGVEGLKKKSYSLSAGHSGETVGVGYDMGQHTMAQIEKDFKSAGISDSKIIAAAKMYASDYTGQAPKSGGVKITKDQAKKLSATVVNQVNRYLENNLAGYLGLSAKEKTVAVSFAYQYGNRAATRKLSSGSYLSGLIGNPNSLDARLKQGLTHMGTLEYRSRRNKEVKYAFPRLN